MRLIRFVLLLVVCLLVLRCKDSTVAPGGTVLNISANPQQIAINGTSQLTASGSSNSGPLSDGTILRFVLETGTGRVSPASVEVTNGVATSKYFASGAEGKATISVNSGSATASIDIQVIGDTNEHVFLLANPSTLPAGGGTTELTAEVTDSIGNPLEGERVLFSTDQGVLKSNGQFVTTDSQGHASDELTTNKTANVKAEVPDVSADPATLTVPVGSTNIECSFTITPQNPTAGQAVTFTDTTQIDQEQIFSSIWDFGDSNSGSGVSVQHTYSTAGTYTIAHVLIDISSNNYSCTNVRLTVQ
jgi:PKD domain-containing protein/Big-like domain-containing protein